MCVKSEDESSLVINRMKEPMFQEYAHERIRKDGAAIPNELINSGAQKVGASNIWIA